MRICLPSVQQIQIEYPENRARTHCTQLYTAPHSITLPHSLSSEKRWQLTTLVSTVNWQLERSKVP